MITQRPHRFTSSPWAALSVAGLLLAVLAIGGCSDDAAVGGPATASSSSGKAASSEPGGDNGTGQTAVPAGQLTAGDWDDNLNFDLFTAYLESAQALSGLLPKLDLSGRTVIHVIDADGQPVPAAKVRIFSGDEDHFVGPTGTDGRVLWLPGVEGDSQAQELRIEVQAPAGMNAETANKVAPDSTDWTIALAGKAPSVAKVDLAFVFDATGSMGDEMKWLQAEIGSIVSELKAGHDNLSLRLALVVYRDVGDAYVTRSFDFTDNVDQFIADLNKQAASGGGDYPEAMDQGLAAMNQLMWRTGTVARVSFLIADAPPKAHNLSKTLDHALTARALGIRLYGLAASGVGDQAEYMLRGMAMLTLARYLFLTDDSGIGQSHADPHIPCHHVMLLHTLVRRTIEAEIAGERTPAPADDIIKSVGKPVQGYCELQGGKKAWL